MQQDTGTLRALTDDLVTSAPTGAFPPPGALLAVIEGAETRYAVTGQAQRLAHVQPVAMDWGVRTDAGSVTKLIGTTTALMGMVDRQAIRVDETANRYLPELTIPDVTIRQLLEHRGGCREWWPLYLSGATGSDAVMLAARLPSTYPAGLQRHYSDLGFILLGELVARATGKALPDAVNELSLSPFGLTETRFAEAAPGGTIAASSTGDLIEQTMIATGVPYPVKGAVTDFTRWRSHVLVGEVNDGNAFHAFAGAAGHAGLFTTATDLLRFARGMLNSLNEQGPISRKTARLFTTVGADPGQALGFRCWHTPAGPALGHTGFPGVGLALFPQHDAAMVLITNRLHTPGPPRPGEQMWTRVLHDVAYQLAGDDDLQGTR